MIASKKLMSWMLVATVFGASAAACSDDDKKSETTVAATAAPADTTGGATDATTAGGSASSNPDVVAFCDAANQLAEDYKKVMADPASGDIGALTASATDLTTKATALSSSSPADAEAISACLQTMTAAMTGG